MASGPFEQHGIDHTLESQLDSNESSPLLSTKTAPNHSDTASGSAGAEDSNTGEDASQVTDDSRLGVYATISVMMVGVFLANIDMSIILAVYGQMASEFDALESGSWFLSAFAIAACVAQPLYGKLSDIYGRKNCLQVAYLLFGIGTAWTALGQTMGQVVAARAVQGAGSAGMTALVSIIVTDLVPIHEVASIRSYVNVLQASSRSFGGVIGGILAEAVGWRWTFGVQVPIMIIGAILVQWRLKLSHHSAGLDKWEKLKRIDFVGAFFLCATIFVLCFVLDVGGQKLPWDSPIILTLIVIGVLGAMAFTISARHAREPIFPLRVITFPSVISNYLILLLQSITQLSLMVAVPIYFQVTQNAGTAASGAYLVPAFAGNLIGGLATGFWIRHTGDYKVPIVLAPFLAMACEVACLIFWTGQTTIAQSLFILPGGLAMGIASSSTLVGAVAGVSEDDIAIATSGSYLFANLGAIGATSVGPATFQITLRAHLERMLDNVKDGEVILRNALADISYVQQADDTIRALIVPAYIAGFHSVNVLGISCAGLALVIAVLTRARRLK